MNELRLLVCVNRRLTPTAVSCGGRGAERLARSLRELLDARGLPVSVEPIYCFGRCGKGPNVRIAPGGRFFDAVTDDDLPSIVDCVAALLAN